MTWRARRSCPGGPVQTERGFVIHESGDVWETSASITDSIHVTTSQDILTSMAAGTGPTRAMVALGYAGWGAGQLEFEITENAWLSVPRQFADPLRRSVRRCAGKKAAGLLGIDLATLSVGCRPCLTRELDIETARPQQENRPRFRLRRTTRRRCLRQSDHRHRHRH